MNMRDYSYMDAYNFALRTKQRFRAAIPKDKITEATRRAWDFEDQHAECNGNQACNCQEQQRSEPLPSQSAHQLLSC